VGNASELKMRNLNGRAKTTDKQGIESAEQQQGKTEKDCGVFVLASGLS
jgi:hypothetical protein